MALYADVKSNKEVEDERIEQTVSKATSELTEIQRGRLREVLKEHRRAFVSGDETFGLCQQTEHSIELRDNIPVVCRPYRCSHADRDFLREQVNILKEKGIVRESDSSYASPTIIVHQPHHESTPKQMVHDYRQSNKKTLNTPYPMPIIEDVIDEVTRYEAQYFNVMDIKKAYLSIGMKPEDIPKTAFVTPDGKYEYTRMAFGFCKAPQTMQAVMRRTFNVMKGTATYMDDTGQGAVTIDECIEMLNEALRGIVVNGLKIEVEKCQLVRTTVQFLGYIITAEGRRPDPKHVADIDKFQPQKDTKRLYLFLQFANYYREFIKDFAKITNPLRKLLHKDTKFQWADKHSEIVDQLKRVLTNPPIIATFVPTASTTVSVDASQTGLGAVLSQVHDGKERVIEYASKSLNTHDSMMHSNVLECMAVHWAVSDKFSIYLRGGPSFKVLSDNYSVVYANGLGKLNRRFAR